MDRELTRDVYYPPINKTRGGLTDEQRAERAAREKPKRRKERGHGRKR